jgi:four helix bundle protein
MTKPESRINDEKTMTKKPPVPEYDLEERTARFGEKVIAFAKSVLSTCVTLPLVSQLVRSATSIGANYCEADDAESRKDFRHKISTCRKESRETKHWLRMLVAADRGLREAVKPLWQEAKELNLIFSAIWRRSG